MLQPVGGSEAEVGIVPSAMNGRDQASETGPRGDAAQQSTLGAVNPRADEGVMREIGVSILMAVRGSVCGA